MDLQLINLCDHDIVIRDCNGKFHTLPACEGEPARVKTDYAPLFYLGTIGVNRQAGTITTNLPPTTENTMYIVSRMVAGANRHRKDLLIPGAQYYSDDGTRYCAGLEIL